MKRGFPLVLILISLIVLSGCAMSALHRAAETGDINEIKSLLEKGADVNAKSYGLTALMRAASEGKIEAMKLLIDRGADIDAVDGFGRTALMVAASEGKIEVLKLLVEKGADVHAKCWPKSGMLRISGWTALHFAAYNGHADMVDFLLTLGMDPKAVSDKGKTPLDEAREGEKFYTKLRKYLDKETLEKINHKAVVKLLTRPVSPPSQALSKEELKTIVQAAVEGATQAQKPETKTAIKTDIDSPSFSPSQILMTENDLAVIIGIEGYQGIPKSDYSYDDAKLMKDYAKALGFQARNIEFLTEEKATLSGITKTIEAWLKNKVKPESRVFVYYSGHGAPEPKTGDAYLVPYDGDPNYLEVTGYPLKRLYDNLGKLNVAEVVVVLDSCFSGSGGRSVIAKGARPLVMTVEGLVLPSNMAVLTSTHGTDISTSNPETGHGVFTYYFLKALKEGKKTLSEIYEYIKPLVENEAKELNVQQSPSISPEIEKLKGRFSLRR